MNKLRVLGGVVAVLGMAGLVVTPVGASSFDAGVLTLEETAANPAGYEWGLDGANGAAFVAHLNAEGKLTIKNATQENILKNLDSLQKYVDEVKADPARAAEWNAFKAAMQNLQEITLKTDNADLKLDDELLARFNQVVGGNELKNGNPTFKYALKIDVGTGVLDASDLSKQQVEELLSMMSITDLKASKILAGGEEQAEIMRANFTDTVPVEVKKAAANQGTPERAGNGLKAPNTGANTVANTGALASLAAAVVLSSLAGAAVVIKNRK